MMCNEFLNWVPYKYKCTYMRLIIQMMAIKDETTFGVTAVLEHATKS